MRLPQFLTQMDKQALRAVCVLLGMFIVVAVVVLMSRSHLSLNDGELAQMLGSVRASGWALPLTVGLFCAAAFIGAPQWVLIAVAVTAFGPMTGGVYAWIATLCSASLNFWLARVIGAAQLDRIAGGFVARIKTLVRKNGVLTSFAVRLVPTGPFVLVNMAAGVSGMRFVSFAIGTAFGIVPKILIVALLGQGLLTAAQGRLFMIVFVIAAVVLIGVMLLARRYLRRFISIAPEP